MYTHQGLCKIVQKLWVKQQDDYPKEVLIWFECKLLRCAKANQGSKKNYIRS